MKRILSALFALVSAASVSAAPFQNGGFELGTPTADPCNFALPVGSTAITGWTVISGNIEYVTPSCWNPSEGTRSLDLVGNGSIGGIEQTFDTVPGQSYEVIFDLAGNPGAGFPAVKNLTVTVNGTPHNYTFDSSQWTTANMGWTPHSFQFVAGGTSSTISFVSSMAPSTFAGAALDNVRVLAIPAGGWSASGGTVFSGNHSTYPGLPKICSGAGATWSQFGGGPFSYPTILTSFGVQGPVIASYAVPIGNTTAGICGSWTVSQTATSAGTVNVAWQYTGDHSSFNTTVDLRAFVVTPSVSVVQSNVVSSVSAQNFSYSGNYSFNVQPGDFYGFEMTGSNFDFIDAMRGTLYVTGTGASLLNLQSSANPAPVGSLVTFTATVTGSNPRGTVAFNDGAIPIAGCSAVPLVPIDSVSSSAACSVSSLSAGGHGINVLYSGDMTNLRAGGMLAQTITATLAPPVLVRALPTGSAVVPLLIGRLDGVASTLIAVRLYKGTTCTNGVLGGTVTQVGPDVSTTTDPPNPPTPPAGYFGTSQGAAQGEPVAIQIVSPQITSLSNCLVTAADNDTWPKALRLEGASVTAPDWIDVAGKARWYRFSVLPGQRINVTLSGLPADYDLAVFKDIASEFTSELVPVNTAQLTRLSAQYAPSAFSPSAFSPSAFSPSAFSPSAFSPSAFSPSAFSPSAFSPSAFSPSAFSPSAFSDEELARAFSSAQTRSIIATSMTPGTGNESVVVNTWNNTGDFYVRVTGRAGAFSTAPYSVAVSKQGTSCAGVTDTTISSRTASAGGYNTIVLLDSSKTPLTAAVPGGTLESKLTAFAGRADVNGVIVDVADPAYARVTALKAQAQASNNVACPFAKNLVAREIKSIVDAYLTTNPLRYIVIVGNDDAIPFFRYPDQSLLGQESGYFPPVVSNSASEASLRNDFVLGQDAYGATTHISLRVSDFPIPGVAVGRLIETPAEIAGMIDAYVATNGSISPTSSLVTGYDFLQDAAVAVRNELQAGIGSMPQTLITPNTVSPEDTRSYANGGPWTANDLRQQLTTRHDVMFLSGHFNANSALAADFKSSVLTSDLAASTNLANTLIFSAGCHAGYNLVDTDAIADVTFPLDWAQAFAKKQATLIAGTGYQYGDTEFLEYSERIYLNFAKELRVGTGKVAIGEALVKAKLAYLAATPDIRGIHEKALLEATVFGLPMLGVNMPAGRTAAPPNGAPVSATLVGAGPAATLGLHTAQISVAPTLTENMLALKNYEPTGPATITAKWLSGPDGVVTNPAEPALPLQVVNVTATDSALVLRSVGFVGGNYSDSTVFPLTGAPTTELRGVHTPFSSPVFFPMRLWTANYYSVLSGGNKTNLLVTPAQHRALDATNSTLRKYSGLTVRLFYSNLTSASNPANAAAVLSAAPTIVRVNAVPTAAVATFSAQVVGDPAAAIHDVWITYTSGTGGSGTWTSVPLQQCVVPLPSACGTTSDSQFWKAEVSTAALPADTKYIVQAVSGTGLLTLDDNLGRYYSFSAAAPAPVATTIAFNPQPPTSATFGGSASITALLSTSGSSPAGIAGKLVTIAVGGGAGSGTTNSSGSVTVNVPMVATPGTYPVTASFGGDASFLPSGVTASPLTVAKAPTSLAALTTGTGAILTALVGGKTQPLMQESIRFSVAGPQGVKDVYAITDYLGRATLPPAGLPAGAYSVTQANFDGNATYAPANSLALPGHFVAPAYRFAGFLQPVDNPPTLNSVKAGQAVPVKFSLGGNRGLAIFDPGYPASQPMNCGTSVDDPIEETLNAGDSSLQYDSSKDQYTYVWKTLKAWAGTCRVLVINFADGSQARANFQFKN